MLLTNTLAQVESLLHSMEQVAKGIGVYENSDKIESMYFYKDGAIPSLNGKPLINQFIYFGSNISSTEINVNIVKAYIAIDRLSTK